MTEFNIEKITPKKRSTVIPDHILAQLNKYGLSVLIPFDDWSSSGKYKLMERVASKVYRWNKLNETKLSVGTESKGIRVWCN